MSCACYETEKFTLNFDQAYKTDKNPCCFLLGFMQRPIFSVITTGRGEKDRKALEETFSNWEIAKKVFEEKNGKSKAIEFIIVDAGENAELP